MGGHTESKSPLWSNLWGSLPHALYSLSHQSCHPIMLTWQSRLWLSSETSVSFPVWKIILMATSETYPWINIRPAWGGWILLVLSALSLWSPLQWSLQHLRGLRSKPFCLYLLAKNPLELFRPDEEGSSHLYFIKSTSLWMAASTNIPGIMGQVPVFALIFLYQISGVEWLSGREGAAKMPCSNWQFRRS